MNGKYLEEVSEEGDLGVFIQNDLKCSKQCLKAVNTAKWTLYYTKQMVEGKMKRKRNEHYYTNKYNNNNLATTTAYV